MADLQSADLGFTGGAQGLLPAITTANRTRSIKRITPATPVSSATDLGMDMGAAMTPAMTMATVVPGILPTCTTGNIETLFRELILLLMLALSTRIIWRL